MNSKTCHQISATCVWADCLNIKRTGLKIKFLDEIFPVLVLLNKN